MRVRRAAALALVIWCLRPVAGLAAQESVNLNSVYTPDKSDWWSTLRPNNPSVHAPIEKIGKPTANPPSAGTFIVAGVNLWDGVPISEAASRIGPAPVIARGDASSARLQTCYQSAADGGRYKLIFEEGEVACNVYLIEHAASWNGIQKCVASTRVSDATATETGLHLGMSPDEVKTILGKPLSETQQKIIYSSIWRRRMTSRELRAFRESTGLSDVIATDRTAEIEIRFRSGKAEYIAISTTDTY